MPTVKETYGFLPISVWHVKDNNVYDKYLVNIETTKRSANCKYLPNLKFSRFNSKVAEQIIKYWSNEGDLILDCFMGYGIRGFVANCLNRRYIGYEISPLMYNNVKEKIKETLIKNMNIYLDDGCKLNQVLNNSIDLIFTCPPYWDLEKYESVPLQLSDCSSYIVFLERLKICIQNCYRVLKNGKFVIWVISDFRKNKQYYKFHIDLIKIFEEYKFKLWDIVINVLDSPFAWCQISKCDKMKYTSKTHEYILVFKKE